MLVAVFSTILIGYTCAISIQGEMVCAAVVVLAFVVLFLKTRGVTVTQLCVHVGFVLLFCRSLIRVGNSVTANLILGNLFLIPFIVLSVIVFLNRKSWHRILSISMLLLLLICVLSAFYTLEFSSTGSLKYQLSGIYYLLNYILFFGFGVSTFFLPVRTSRLIFHHIKFWGVLSALAAVLEQIFRSRYISYLLHTNPLGVIPGTIITNFHGAVVYRSIGLFDDPNYLGSFMVVFILVTIANGARRSYKVATIMLALAALICSDSRSSIIGLCAVFALYLCGKAGRDTKTALIAVGLISSLIIYFTWPVISQLLALHNGSGQYHLRSIFIGVQEMFSHPFGVGIGNTGLARNSSWGNSDPTAFVGSETGYLQIGVQIGLVGMVVFIGTLVGSYRQLAKFRESGDMETKIAMYSLSLLIILYVFLPVNNQTVTLFLAWVFTGRATIKNRTEQRNAHSILH